MNQPQYNKMKDQKTVGRRAPERERAGGRGRGPSRAISMGEMWSKDGVGNQEPNLFLRRPLSLCLKSCLRVI